MQIKLASRMAKSDDPITLHANTSEENKQILHDLRNRSYGVRKSREDLKKLLNKLNHNCQIQSIKDGSQQNPTWRSKSVTDYTYGPIAGFPSGSWWGIRMDCSRDRVHDPFDEDIQVGPFGVTSICTSNSYTEDADLGDSLTLTGARYAEDKKRESPLIVNYENQVPVRLIRCYNLLNKYAPKTGYRYDGLYAVVRFWIGVNASKEKYYKFALVRLLNQEAPPWNTRRATFDTRHSFATDFQESQSFTNYTDQPLQNAYKFRKKSHVESRMRAAHSIKFSEPENATVIEKPKCTPESVIVTRHVFKKSTTSGENTLCPSTSSTSENKAFLKIGQGSKAQSTNISIRTGLYDSSNSMQHDAKRSSLATFCRTTKSIPVLKTNLLEAHNAPNRDKSKIEAKPELVPTSHKHQEPDALNHKPNTVSTTITASGVKEKAEVATSTSTSLENGSPLSYEGSEKLNNNLDLSVSSCQSSNSDETKLASNEMAKDSYNLHGLKPLELLDSLTPDKILHLIDKEKCHPLSKVLMGNMLGFTSEQSVTLRSFDKLHTDLNGKENAEKKNFKAINDDLISSRCYKFRRRKRMPRKLLSKSDSKLQLNFGPSASVLPDHASSKSVNDQEPKSLKSDSSKGETRSHAGRSALENTRKETSISLRVKRRNMAKSTEKESTVRSRLRNVNAIRVKKHVNKKQRREITNLLIDAKIGPKVRGPRNRRLRCINPVYTKRPYEPFSTMIRTLNKHPLTTDMQEQGSLFRGRNKLRKVKRRTHMKPSDEKYTESSNEEEKPKDDAELEARETSTPNRTRKRKLEAPTTESTNHNKIQESPEGREVETPKPCKIDAVTQCSLISHKTMESSGSSLERIKFNDYIRLNERNGRPTRVKIERADSKYMKSEILEECEISDDDNYEVYVVRKGQGAPHTIPYPGEKEMARIVGYDSPSASTPKVAEKLPRAMQRVSAFVPVNTVDSDLRIARLRSIGFKPISSESGVPHTVENYSKSSKSKVVKQDVSEKYNKYTNEENSLVVYMDEELQYEDIENEIEPGVDASSVEKSGTPSSRSSEESFLDEPRVKRDKSEPTCNAHAALPDQDLDAPWHGWKKVVTSKESYWIGW